MATQFEYFIATMKKVLMLDQADLDFGIYRIMNQKRDQIESYLNNDLRKQVTEAIRENTSNDAEELKKELASLVSTLTAAGMNPDDAPKVKELKERIAQCGNSEDLENEVYSHLSVFFSRYYDGGDFVSQRRYKKDVYAIPYEGEEVKLHWANADQYYIKTGEYFRNYRFAIGDGKFCEFTLREATTEQNNNVAQNNMERRFAICEENPVEVVGDTLHIYFTYELYPKATKQKALMEKAFDAVKDAIPQEFYVLFSLRPTESDRNRTLLQKHLMDYVARNTFDYFIHKDLGGFLSRELDFYIKNEILVIDDIDARTPDEFLKHLAVIKTIKTVGMKLITFLASLENYQKRLWLKKKFVVQADYCITLDRVPESLYAEIAANDAQREEWVCLFAIDEIKSNGMFTEGYSVPLTEKFLQENPFLVLDTKFFSAEFKNKLLASIDNIDEQCDGLLINSENFQALELLQEKYTTSIGGVYYDPPYNTKKNEFIFKDSMKHSSWITMMNNRLLATRKLMTRDSAIMISCDENEVSNLRILMSQVFGEDNYLSDIIWEGSSKNDQKYLSVSHEYILTALRDKAYLDETEIRWTERKKGLEKIYEAFEKIREKYPNDYAKQQEEIKKWFKALPNDDPAKKQKHYSVVEKRGLYFPDNISKPEKGYYYDLIHPVTGKPCKKPKGGWRFIESTMKEQLADDRIHFGPDENTVPCRKSFLKETEYESPSTVTYLDNRVSTALMKEMFNDKKVFDNPKYYLLIARFLKLIAAKNACFLDIFAGSGTTAHSVIYLNREDNGSRKYVLSEMAEYFDKVTKPRIQKVIYSKDWKDGKPVSRQGSSHCFKYMRLEQYEDTLNNLTIEPSNIDKSNVDFYGGYILGYMLDMETRNSLFNMQWFRNPWNMKLRITRQNETREENVDVIETFNYLIGLNVKRILHPRKGICTVEGVTRRGERTLIIWRDCDMVDNDALNDFFCSTDNATRNTEFDRIYVNGDNNLENLRTEGEQWKVVLTEQEFAKRMFEDC